jgi:simple sugar transport system permease protein
VANNKPPLFAIILTLVSGGLLFATLGQDPFHALYTFFIAPLSDVYGWTELGVKVAPLTLCAIGLMLCFKAKVWNIGAEGQFILGGLGGGYIALELMDAEGFWVLPLVLFFGALSGLFWGAITALLKTRVGANEILTTIMLNYIALNWLLYGVHGPLKDPEGFNFPESALFSDFATLIQES